MDLAQLSVNNVFAMLLVFVRIGSIFMIMPGIGDSFIPVRTRLMIALAISFVVFPIIEIPNYPKSPLILANIILTELVVGCFIGIIIRLMLAVINITGFTIASQSGLGSAMLFDPTQNTQGAVISTFLSMLAITAIFSTDLYQAFIKGFIDSYSLFKAGHSIIISDFVDHLLETLREIFIISLKMMAPQVVLSLVVMVGAGVLSRLMPALHIFFLITPIQILTSFAMLMLTISVTMAWYLNGVGEVIVNFLSAS